MENNNEVDKVVLRDLFNAIRNAEIKNVKIQKLDDKQMAKQITKYISKKVGENIEWNLKA